MTTLRRGPLLPRSGKRGGGGPPGGSINTAIFAAPGIPPHHRARTTLRRNPTTWQCGGTETPTSAPARAVGCPWVDWVSQSGRWARCGIHGQRKTAGRFACERRLGERYDCESATRGRKAFPRSAMDATLDCRPPLDLPRLGLPPPCRRLAFLFRTVFCRVFELADSPSRFRLPRTRIRNVRQRLLIY